MSTQSPIDVEALSLAATDGYALSARRFNAKGTLRGRIIVAGATGVPQHFYKHFAQYAAEQGYTTLTFDYRGIGESKPASLRGFNMDYLDWATKDLPMVVDAMASDEMPLFLVGHSFGGHAFGLIPNHAKVARFYTFGTGAGWHGWMPRAERFKVLLMWNVVGPLITRWQGYLAWSKLGMGEDLPLGVYRDWKRWCRFPRYFFDDPAMTSVTAHFNQVKTPIVAANALDDLWAKPASRDAFMAGYGNASCEKLDITPHRDGLGAIGHMGYFRRNAQPLWKETLQWFAEHRAERTTSAPQS